MKDFIFLAICGLLMASCMSTSKFTSIVKEKIDNEKIEFQDYPWLIIESNKEIPQELRCDQKENKFVPAIFYWEWNSTIECELDASSRLNFLKQGIYEAADSLNLINALGDKVLMIKIKESPGKFIYENKGNVLFLLIAYTTSSTEAISPYPLNLEYSYQYHNDDIVVGEGFGQIQNMEHPLQNVWRTSKFFTWKYLDELKKESQRMGEELVLTILSDLDK